MLQQLAYFRYVNMIYGTSFVLNISCDWLDGDGRVFDLKKMLNNVSSI